MALHISEIGLRLAIGEPGSGGAQAPAAQAGRGGAEASLSAVQMEDIVQTCVAEVLRTLGRLEER